MPALNWVKGYTARGDGPTPRTQMAVYSVKGLAERGLISQNGASRLLVNADLIDFSFRLIWGEDYATPDEELPDRIGNVDGYAVFIHGWTGCHAIWEDMPGLLINRNRNLVSLLVDHNAFGDSPFSDRTPEYDECSPVAAMKVIEGVIELLAIRRQIGDPRPKTVNFIGHSMGGAALFFIDESRWRLGELTRTAIAPALLLHDDLGRAFFTTLGFGIGLVGRLTFLEAVERLVSPRVLETLTEGASEAVRAEHDRIYKATPRSVTARTLAAMGTIKDHPMPRKWTHMQVFLGHRDALVGLIPMLDLLNELSFDVDQVRVMLGTHYLFSLGEAWERVHRQNRDIIVGDILKLHERALQRQKTG
jgi:pimeloyl-ACP methyl ester carboxylesterase